MKRSRPTSSAPTGRVSSRFFASGSTPVGNLSTKTAKVDPLLLLFQSHRENRDRKKGGHARVAKSCKEDVCAICLVEMRGATGEKAVPETCRHMFCRSCLETWTRLSRACPLCKSIFTRFALFESVGECGVSSVWARKGWINVPKPPEPDAASATESESLCLRCRRGDREDQLLLCDGCDAATHTYCLDPPLSCVPEGKWFCERCARPGRASFRRRRRVLVARGAADDRSIDDDVLNMRTPAGANSVHISANVPRTQQPPRRRIVESSESSSASDLDGAEAPRANNRGSKGLAGSTSSAV